MPRGAMQCQIIHVDRFSSFQWEIPCFPVLKLEFVKVLFKIGTEISDGVIQKKAAANIQRGDFISFCVRWKMLANTHQLTTLSPPNWKFHYQNALRSQCAHRLVSRCVPRSTPLGLHYSTWSKHGGKWRDTRREKHCQFRPIFFFVNGHNNTNTKPQVN